MKNFKKLFALLLVVAMMFAVAMPVMAAADGSITITNATIGETYTIYKVFDLTYSGTNVAYTYDGSDDEFLAALEGSALFEVEENLDGTYNIVKAAGAADADIIAFIEANEAELGAAVATVVADATTETVGNLGYGYYYVTSTLGTLVTIDSAMKDVEITDKNVAPSIEKEVQEGAAWGESNDAKIGDTVEFKITITAYEGAQGYVVHDALSAGLTLNAESIAVAGATPTTHYTVVTDPEQLDDNCDFEITFTQAYLDTVVDGQEIVITYDAVLNASAAIVDANTNTATLDYGTGKTVTDTTNTYTWEYNVFKYTGTDTALADAKFSLYTDADCTQIVKFNVKDTNVYLFNTAGAVSEITTDATGTFNLEGLDSGTYYLKETAAPNGYNRLTDPITVTIGADGAVSVAGGEAIADKTVDVLNNTGVELPATGGIGTKLFILFGSVAVLMAGIFLITNKRMSKENI